MMQQIETFKIRPFTDSDISSILRIDKKLTGELRPDYWQRKVATLDGSGTVILLIALSRNEVIGFLLAEIRSGEFRQKRTGWITEIGVDPDFRRTGVGRMLMAEILHFFRQNQLDSVRTMVEWCDGDMVSYFTAMGFDRGPYIELEKKLQL
jgi:ribosomal protein S18 acetylase RimI-like enzyme